MILIFQMEEMVERTPNRMIHNMSNVEFAQYNALNKRKSEMIEELKILTTIDGDI